MRPDLPREDLVMTSLLLPLSVSTSLTEEGDLIAGMLTQFSAHLMRQQHKTLTARVKRNVCAQKLTKLQANRRRCDSLMLA